MKKFEEGKVMELIKKFFAMIAGLRKLLVVEVILDLSLFFLLLALVAFFGKAIVLHHSGELVANKIELVGRGLIVLVAVLISRISLT
jgi:hypothetical protein